MGAHFDGLDQGEETLRTEDILGTIETEGDAIAVVMLSGVQYYTGQLFDMAAIAAVGQGMVKTTTTLCFVCFSIRHLSLAVFLLLRVVSSVLIALTLQETSS